MVPNPIKSGWFGGEKKTTIFGGWHPSPKSDMSRSQWIDSDVLTAVRILRFTAGSRIQESHRKTNEFVP